jgi:hypothetical protein
MSQIFIVLSSDAEAIKRESEDHAMSDIPCVCPSKLISNLPSVAVQILIVLSAAVEWIIVE